MNIIPLNANTLSNASYNMNVLDDIATNPRLAAMLLDMQNNVYQPNTYMSQPMANTQVMTGASNMGGYKAPLSTVLGNTINPYDAMRVPVDVPQAQQAPLNLTLGNKIDPYADMRVPVVIPPITEEEAQAQIAALTQAPQAQQPMQPTAQPKAQPKAQPQAMPTQPQIKEAIEEKKREISLLELFGQGMASALKDPLTKEGKTNTLYDMLRGVTAIYAPQQSAIMEQEITDLKELEKEKIKAQQTGMDFIQKLTTSGNYTGASIAKYMQTGDLSDLQAQPQITHVKEDANAYISKTDPDKVTARVLGVGEEVPSNAFRVTEAADGKKIVEFRTIQKDERKDLDANRHLIKELKLNAQKLQELGIETDPLLGIPVIGDWKNRLFNEPEVQALVANVGKIFQKYRKEVTGAQASVQEIELLMRDFPNLTEGNVDAFLAKTRGLTNTLARYESDKIEMLMKNKYDVSPYEDGFTNNIFELNKSMGITSSPGYGGATSVVYAISQTADGKSVILDNGEVVTKEEAKRRKIPMKGQ